MIIPIFRTIDTSKIENKLDDIRDDNKEQFEELKEIIDDNSKTITIPLKQYKELNEKVDFLEQQLRRTNSENEKLLDNYLKFAEDNGATIEVKEFDYQPNRFKPEILKYEEIYIPSFKMYRIKR